MAAFASGTDLHPFLQAAYIAHKEDVKIAVLGRP